MADGIEMTAAQLAAALDIAEREGHVVVRQVDGEPTHGPMPDISVTVVGSDRGHRISGQGDIGDVSPTLPGVEHR